jgi:hypothetical protein
MVLIHVLDENKMAADECQVEVHGLSHTVDQESLLLYLESQRYCPQGGVVEDVNFDYEKAAFIVKFQDPAGAFRLITSVSVLAVHMQT